LGQNLRSKSLQIVRKQVSTLIKHHRIGNVSTKFIPFLLVLWLLRFFFVSWHKARRELTHARCKSSV